MSVITAIDVKMIIARTARHIAMTAMKQYVWAVQVSVKFVMSLYVQAVFRNVLNVEYISARDVLLKVYVQVVNS